MVIQLRATVWFARAPSAFVSWADMIVCLPGGVALGHVCEIRAMVAPPRRIALVHSVHPVALATEAVNLSSQPFSKLASRWTDARPCASDDPLLVIVLLPGVALGRVFEGRAMAAPPRRIAIGGIEHPDALAAEAVKLVGPKLAAFKVGDPFSPAVNCEAAVRTSFLRSGCLERCCLRHVWDIVQKAVQNGRNKNLVLCEFCFAHLIHCLTRNPARDPRPTARECSAACERSSPHCHVPLHDGSELEQGMFLPSLSKNSARCPTHKYQNFKWDAFCVLPQNTSSEYTHPCVGHPATPAA